MLRRLPSQQKFTKTSLPRLFSKLTSTRRLKLTSLPKNQSQSMMDGSESMLRDLVSKEPAAEAAEVATEVIEEAAIEEAQEEMTTVRKELKATDLRDQKAREEEVATEAAEMPKALKLPKEEKEEVVIETKETERTTRPAREVREENSDRTDLMVKEEEAATEAAEAMVPKPLKEAKEEAATEVAEAVTVREETTSKEEMAREEAEEAKANNLRLVPNK